MELKEKVVAFCDKWIELFSNENTSYLTLMDDSSFAEDCCLFDWEMDCGNAFFQKYKCKSFNDALPYINQEDTIALLGSLLFSHWRYFNHWAYSGIEILEYRNWFVIVLQRIKSLQSTL